MIQTELKRKLFHLTGIIYVAGLFFLPRRTYALCLGILLAIELGVEFLRFKNEYVRALIERFGGSLLRKSEHTGITGVTWMTAGILSTILILPEPRLSAAAVLFLLLGDGVASLAGMTLGGPHWGSSPRRISGSAACLLVCLITGVVLLRPEFPWNGILIGAVVATVVEGVGIPNLNDNFLIPLTSAIVFFLTYILSAN